MIRSQLGVLAILALLLGFLSCSSDLTRERAVELISGNEEFQKRRPTFYTTNLRFDTQAAARCGRGSLWEWVGRGDADPQLTDKGREYYQSARTHVIGGFVGFELRTPPKLVEVTGMTGEGQQRQVEYTWKYEGIDSLPEAINQCIEANGGVRRAAISGALDLHTGTATFQLYDDGWRLVALEL